MSKHDELKHSARKRKLEGHGHEFVGEMTGDRGQVAKGKFKKGAAEIQQAIGETAENLGRKLKK